ncbi:ion channel [Halomonadaceae bacterium KBTZ08]
MSGLLLVIPATALAVIGSTILHYGAASILAKRLHRIALAPASGMILLVLSLFVVHMLEIGLFGILAWSLVNHGQAGALEGMVPVASPGDFLYFSVISYTTLGYGEIYPTGAIRFLYGAEALMGFLLITWSASFSFLHMQRLWR